MSGRFDTAAQRTQAPGVHGPPGDPVLTAVHGVSVHRYNATARPFQWKFTPADLDDLLTRIDQHQQQTTAPAIPEAARSTPDALPPRITKADTRAFGDTGQLPRGWLRCVAAHSGRGRLGGDDDAG